MTLTPERVKEIREKFVTATPLEQCLTDLELSALLDAWEEHKRVMNVVVDLGFRILGPEGKRLIDGLELAKAFEKALEGGKE